MNNSTDYVLVGVHDIPVAILESSKCGLDGGTVILLHENRGISSYMISVADQLCQSGFRVLMPDLLWRLGGSRQVSAVPHDLFPETMNPRNVPISTHVSDVEDVANWAEEQGYRLSLFGICFGAEVGWLVASKLESLQCTIGFYGESPDRTVVKRISAPAFSVLAADDLRVNRTMTEFVAGFGLNGGEYRIHQFIGTKHAFHHHERHDRFHPQAAADAWKDAMSFLDEWSLK